MSSERGELMFFHMQRKRKSRTHVGVWCMCATVDVPALDVSNKIPKESGSTVFWIIIILNFSEADISNKNHSTKSLSQKRLDKFPLMKHVIIH